MKLVLIGAVLLIVIGGVWYISGNKTSEPGNQVSPDLSAEAPSEVEGAKAEGNLVSITSSGFSLSTLGIKQGETVTFKNEDTQPSWPASAIHPTHTVYPNSSIAKCGTAEENTIFDSCKGLATGEAWSFQFDIPGTWKYHDHLNPSHSGTIIVE